MFKQRLFRADIPPACAYCELGSPASEPGQIVCPKQGFVAEDFSCRRFRYAPLKRVPPPPIRPRRLEDGELEL